VQVFWKEPGRLLQIEAQSADELNLIGELAHGYLPGSTWLRVPVADVPFACSDRDGITTLMGTPCKVIGLLWDLDPSSERNTQLQAAQTLGKAVYQLLSALPIKTQADLGIAAARVTPVKGELDE